MKVPVEAIKNLLFKSIDVYNAQGKSKFLSNWQLNHHHGSTGLKRANMLKKTLDCIDNSYFLSFLYDFLNKSLRPLHSLSMNDCMLLNCGNYYNSSLRTFIIKDLSAFYGCENKLISILQKLKNSEAIDIEHYKKNEERIVYLQNQIRGWNTRNKKLGHKRVGSGCFGDVYKTMYKGKVVAIKQGNILGDEAKKFNKANEELNFAGHPVKATDLGPNKMMTKYIPDDRNNSITYDDIERADNKLQEKGYIIRDIYNDGNVKKFGDKLFYIDCGMMEKINNKPMKKKKIV